MVVILGIPRATPTGSAGVLARNEREARTKLPPTRLILPEGLRAWRRVAGEGARAPSVLRPLLSNQMS